MKLRSSMFSNDLINKSGFRFPAATLMESQERHHKECLANGMPIGTPSHLQHDMHRPIGWAWANGLLIEGEMVSVRGTLAEAETAEEKYRIATAAADFWSFHHSDGMELNTAELADKIAPYSLDQANFYRIEAYVASKKGLAADLYPALFSQSSEAVDKDGLTDYRTLLTTMEELQPGVFYDASRDLVLFAHRFFRRSLSHQNKLNTYFLQSFCNVAKDHPDLNARLRLDPDLIGHRGSVQELIELEHWRGPRYTDEIQAIPTGVSEHKASERIRYFEGVDRTQIWWKSSETRQVEGKSTKFRSLEIEELIENSSDGLPGDTYGCRYAHAEFSFDDAAITHFDGAIRSYPMEQYLERIETSIDRAGKNSTYTKLFRFDKKMAVAVWKKLLSDFFRGNSLIPEYLGAQDDGIDETLAVDSHPILNEGVRPNLAAFISLDIGVISAGIQVERQDSTLPDGQYIASLETGCESVHGFIANLVDLSNVVAMGAIDGTLNLSRITFGEASDLQLTMQKTTAIIADALNRDYEKGCVLNTSVPLAWQHGELTVTLTIAGAADLVARTLIRLFSVVDTSKSPSQWIQALADLISELAPVSMDHQKWSIIQSGMLRLRRTEDVSFRLILPEEIMQSLTASGDLPKDP